MLASCTLIGVWYDTTTQDFEFEIEKAWYLFFGDMVSDKVRDVCIDSSLYRVSWIADKRASIVETRDVSKDLLLFR